MLGGVLRSSDNAVLLNRLTSCKRGDYDVVRYPYVLDFIDGFVGSCSKVSEKVV